MNDDFEEEVLNSTIGADFLNIMYGGEGFINCLIELFKNCRDAKASKIWIETTDESCIRLIDNGKGMDKDNRSAFVSLNDPTGKDDKKKASQYGTGSKRMMFSFSERISVRTAPEDTPGVVYVFEFTLDELKGALTGTGPSLTATPHPKDSSIWEHDFEYGTDLVFYFSDASHKDIARSVKLAKELAARQPAKFRDIIVVDGDAIPEKEIVGDWYSLADRSNNHLGEVDIEMYVPKRKAKEEGLYLGGIEQGEVPIAELAKYAASLRNGLPEVFLRPEVAGVIRCYMFQEFSTEDRKTLHPKILNDRRLSHFIRMLEKIAPDVERQLGITIVKYDPDSDVEIEQLAESFRKTYANQQKKVGTILVDDVIVEEDRDSSDVTQIVQKKKAPLMQLALSRTEYGVGEQVHIAMYLRGRYKARGNDVHWTYSEDVFDHIETTDKGITLLAKEPGQGFISADLPGEPLSKRASLTVVKERVPRIHPQNHSLEVGTELRLKVYNRDKLRGEPIWDHEGVGTLTRSSSDRMVFTASRTGLARIKMIDGRNSRYHDECVITVTPTKKIPDDIIPIRDRLFRIQPWNTEGTDQYQKPATMQIGDGHIHTLIINKSAPGYTLAQANGTLHEMLLVAVCQQYTRFIAYVINERQVDPRDSEENDDKLTVEGFEVYQELLESMRKK